MVDRQFGKFYDPNIFCVFAEKQFFRGLEIFLLFPRNTRFFKL